MRDLFKQEQRKDETTEKRLAALEKKINTILALIQDLQNQPQTELQTYEEEVIEEPQEITLPKEEIIISQEPIQKELHKHKKSVIKEKIIGELTKEQQSASQLKKHIVDHLKYCSKASFYRYIDELRNEGKIERISINSREYLIKTENKNI